MELSSQWRVVAGMGGAMYQGLDHASVLATLRLMGIGKRDRVAIFQGLRTMEQAALPVLNEREDAA